MATILLIDDERIIHETLAPVLASNGFLVRSAFTGAAGLEAFRAERPDLVLLDVMMPVMDGYEACREMREHDRETPVVFLSALDSERDQIKGLEVGGDDYVSKTASDELLVARLEKALERTRRFSPCDAPSSMTRTEAAIYRVLKSERGRYFTYREIFSAICGEGYYADEGAIRSHVSRLRAKLPQGEGVEAKRGRGYALNSK